MGMKEVGTLKELDVKPGDVVENMKSGFRYKITDDMYVGCVMVKHSTALYKLISRASDTPKLSESKPRLWREMTDAEKGALLLAHHEGEVIEFLLDDEWDDCDGSPSWIPECAYRIRPEPKIETVTINYWEIATDVLKNHHITFNTIDGKPDLASIKMEKL